MRAAAHPVLDAVQVEADQLLVVHVGQGVVGAQLLDVFAVTRPLVERRHHAVEGPVGLLVAGESQPDDDVALVVLLQQRRRYRPREEYCQWLAMASLLQKFASLKCQIANVSLVLVSNVLNSWKKDPVHFPHMHFIMFWLNGDCVVVYLIYWLGIVYFKTLCEDQAIVLISKTIVYLYLCTIYHTHVCVWPTSLLTI